MSKLNKLTRRGLRIHATDCQLSTNCGADHYSFTDLNSEKFQAERRSLRYPGPGGFSFLLLACALDDYIYLAIDCPSTKLAQKKLAEIRAFYRGDELAWKKVDQSLRAWAEQGRQYED